MKLLLITLALLLAFTSAMRIKQDDTCEIDEDSFEEDGVTCTSREEDCDGYDIETEECPGKRVASK